MKFRIEPNCSFTVSSTVRTRLGVLLLAGVSRLFVCLLCVAPERKDRSWRFLRSRGLKHSFCRIEALTSPVASGVLDGCRLYENNHLRIHRQQRCKGHTPTSRSVPPQAFELQNLVVAVPGVKWHNQTLQCQWKHKSSRHWDEAPICTKTEVVDGSARTFQSKHRSTWRQRWPRKGFRQGLQRSRSSLRLEPAEFPRMWWTKLSCGWQRSFGLYKCARFFDDAAVGIFMVWLVCDECDTTWARRTHRTYSNLKWWCCRPWLAWHVWCSNSARAFLHASKPTHAWKQQWLLQFRGKQLKSVNCAYWWQRCFRYAKVWDCKRSSTSGDTWSPEAMLT